MDRIAWTDGKLPSASGERPSPGCGRSTLRPLAFLLACIAHSNAQTTTPRVPDSLEWRVAVRATEELAITSDGTEVVVHGPGGRLHQGGKVRTLECGNDRESLDPRVPDLLVTDFVPMSSCPGTPALWRKSGAGWTRLRNLPAHEILIARWTKGRALLATVPWREGPPWGYSLALVPGGAAPRPEPAGVDSSHGDRRTCHTRLQDPLHLWTFASGDIFLVGGGECPAPLASKVVVEHWVQGATRSRFDRLPIESLTGAIAPARDNLWLAGPLSHGEKDRIVHFDGKGWTLLPNPIQDTIVRIAWQAADDVDPESMWILSDSLLWRWMEPRTVLGGGEAKAFALPPRCPEPGTLAIRDGHPWIACGTVVHTTDPGIEPLDWPFASGAPCPRRWIPGTAGPPSSGCSHRERDGGGSEVLGPTRKIEAPRPIPLVD